MIFWAGQRRGGRFWAVVGVAEGRNSISGEAKKQKNQIRPDQRRLLLVPRFPSFGYTAIRRI